MRGGDGGVEVEEETAVEKTRRCANTVAAAECQHSGSSRITAAR
jgi:hypothetical protein